MSKYKSYFQRVKNAGNSNQEAVINSSKRQVNSYFMNSPSLSSVNKMLLEKQSDGAFILIHDSQEMAIVSDIETFYRRSVLLPPDNSPRIGTYMDYDNKFYLITEANTDPLYPKGEMRFCNDEFEVKKVTDERVLDGKDEFGRPIYKTKQVIYKLPCVVETKIYSVAENAPIPLPDGVVNILIPYHPEITVPVNYDFYLQDNKYQVTTVSHEKVVKLLNGETYGYISIRGQRGVGEK